MKNHTHETLVRRPVGLHAQFVLNKANVTPESGDLRGALHERPRGREDILVALVDLADVPERRLQRRAALLAHAKRRLLYGRQFPDDRLVLELVLERPGLVGVEGEVQQESLVVLAVAGPRVLRRSVVDAGC